MEKRFKTEIEILATLECPYIVRLLHAGMHSGRPYLVMEWLDGMTLRDFLNQRREPIALEDALHYAICIATALCAAHAESIFHRDLKPENVFMVEKGTLKVLDFGLGKWATSNRVSTSEQLGGGLCTVHYAAPEQLENTGVDDRTDIRALALIFMEVATLRYAFADRPGVLPPKEIARANQLLAEPPSLRTLLPDCPPSLATLIDAALRRDKTQRPHSTDFLAGLRDERRKLREATKAAAARIEDEDSADEAGPAPAPAKPAHETSAVRVIRQIRTLTLDASQPPGDPTAAGNPLPPPVKTTKMAVAPEPEVDAARRAKAAHEAAARDAAARHGQAGDVTSGGRSATVPPEPARTHVPQAPDGSLAYAPAAPPPAGSEAPTLLGHDAAAERASLELATGPTLPWQRALPARDATPSLSPTDNGPSRAGGPRRRGPPAWVPLLLGATVTFVVFMGIKLVQAHARHAHEEASATPTASATATPAPTATAEASATAAPTATAEASASATPTATAEASATPTATAEASATPTATAETPVAATASPTLAATPVASTTAAPYRMRPASAAHAQPAQPRVPKPAEPPPPPPPAPSAAQNPHRMFGAEQ
jgi:Protein kinase domain